MVITKDSFKDNLKYCFFLGQMELIKEDFPKTRSIKVMTGKFPSYILQYMQKKCTELKGKFPFLISLTYQQSFLHRTIKDAQKEYETKQYQTKIKSPQERFDNIWEKKYGQTR